MTKSKQPFIIIGMHRSGTSMITKMLRDLGLFVGWDFSDEYEALFFLNRNEKILNACGGGWNNPTVINNLLNHTELRKKAVNLLYNDLNSIYLVYFLGPKLFIKYRSVFNLDIPWGWKDPRNTFLLPIWLDIFPEAKIIHIYRNGLDIASSLAVREVKRINRVSSSHRSIRVFIDRQVNLFREKKSLLFLIRKVQDLYRKMSPLGKYGDMKIHPCISIEKGFKLWCTYIEKAFEHVETLPNEVYNFKFEEFLIKPENYLEELCSFCTLPADKNNIQTIVSQINLKRRNAFKNNESLMNFYESVKDNYWIRKLGYHLETHLKVQNI